MYDCDAMQQKHGDTRRKCSMIRNNQYVLRVDPPTCVDLVTKLTFMCFVDVP